MPKNGDLRIWYVPQVPMKAFHSPVNTIQEAAAVLRIIAEYDLFQLHNNVKGDYCSTGGLQIWDETLDPDEETGSKWCDWYDEETGFDFEEYQEFFPKMFDGSN